MVSNYDRIYQEILKRAQTIAGENEVDSNALVTLVMEIVDLEDQHRTRNIRINQLVQDRIQTAAMSHGGAEE